MLVPFLLKHAEDVSSDKITTYIESRLTPQLKWYSVKAKHNSTMSRVFFATFITCNFFAVLCSAWQETDTSFTLPITGLLIALSTALIGWIESKKYSELAAAYSLTHGEIELLHSDIHDISSRENFSAFVNDAESLFSREHTQWAAKRRYIRKI
ncbi:SLATT domain-containing protein [Pseudomonas gingeri]|uniref:SLATT domain-containing protein n=1 Tax=Pseudomonas gingeri TaxID=117681 RepID=UPI00351C5771